MPLPRMGGDIPVAEQLLYVTWQLSLALPPPSQTVLFALLTAHLENR